MEKDDPAEDEHEPTPDSDFASIVETKSDKRKQTPQRKAADPDHKKSYRRSWRSASPLTKLMIYFTALIAVSTLIYAAFAGWQWYEIHSGAEETRRLAQAARDSADAAQRQANIAVEQLQAIKDATTAAKDSAEAARDAVRQNEDLVKAAQTQADTSQVAARAAEESARVAAQSLSIGERPYIATRAAEISNFEVGQRPTITIHFDNSGRTPGLNAAIRSYGAVRPEKKLGTAATYPKVPSLSTSIVQSGCCMRQAIPAFAEDLPQEAVNALIQAIKQGQLWLFVYGIAEYDDGAGKRHTLLFCQYYNTQIGGLFTYCAEHNSSN